MRKMIVMTGATLAVAAGAVLFVLREPVLLAVGDYLILQDKLQRADVIAVVSGPDDRTDHAIELYKGGYGERLFFTGGWCDTVQDIHAARGRARAMTQGVPAEAIATDDTEVTSTYAEAVRLKAYLDDPSNRADSVIVVSDPFHMRRAQWTYQRVLGEEVAVQMAPVPFAMSSFQRRWWSDAESTQYVKDEYLKLVYYQLRYQLGPGPLRDWLASLDRD